MTIERALAIAAWGMALVSGMYWERWRDMDSAWVLVPLAGLGVSFALLAALVASLEPPARSMKG